MTKIVLQSYPAEPAKGAVEGIAIIFDFTNPMPKEIVEVQGVAGAAAALEAYKTKAAATGKCLAVAIGLAKGERSPPGFKKAFKSFYGVNVPTEVQ